MSHNLNKVYQILYTEFGPQGWWPVYDSGFKTVKYHPRRYRVLNEKEAFEISVGAILTQNTTWKNVEKCIIKLNEYNLISPYALNKLNSEKLESLIRSSGYYKQKTLKLKYFSRWLISEGGNLLTLPGKYNLSQIRERLLSVKGIGRETADSIILYAMSLPTFVIDSYTKRIYSRLFSDNKEYEYDALKKIFEAALKSSYILYNEYHALIVKLAKDYCLKNNPLCEKCVLKKICNYGRNNERKKL